MQVPEEDVDLESVGRVPSQHGLLSKVVVRMQMRKGAARAQQTLRALKDAGEQALLLRALDAAGLASAIVLRGPEMGDTGMFERGSVCHVQVLSPMGSLGHIDSLQLGHDGLDSADAWLCEDVYVRLAHEVFAQHRKP